MFKKMIATVRRFPVPTVAVALSVTVLAICLGVFLHNDELISSSSLKSAEKLVASMSTDRLFDVSSEYFSPLVSPYEDKDALSLLRLKIDNSSPTLSRAEDYTDSCPSFDIYLDGRKCFTLKLKSKSVNLLGSKWTLKELTVSEDTTLGRPLTVQVPKGAEVSVNGYAIPRSDSSAVPYYALSPLEQSLSEEMTCDSYELGVFFSLPDVVVTLDGKRLSADTIEGDCLRYPYPSSMVSGYTVTVPYGSAVTVNGIALDRSYSVARSEPYPFTTRFEEGLTSLPTSVVYQLSGLFSEPEITVTYGGATLDHDGEYRYRLPEEATRTVVIRAPSYATVKLNGMTLSAAELTGSGIELPILDGVTSYASVRPYLNEYTVVGLFEDWTVTATDSSGKPLEISKYYSTPDMIFFCCTRSSAMPDKEKLTLRTFGREYVEYVYNGNNNLAANYKDITAMTPGTTPAYYALHDLYKSLYNAPKYKSISVGTVEFLEYYPYSSKAMSVIMDVPFTATLDGVKYQFHIIMDVSYIYSGEIRRIVSYKILDTVSTPI